MVLAPTNVLKGQWQVLEEEVPNVKPRIRFLTLIAVNIIVIIIIKNRRYEVQITTLSEVEKFYYLDNIITKNK